MCIGMLQLADHPDIQEEIYQEQVSLYGTSKDAAPSIADLNSMNLLDRFIKETLRHNPAVPLISRTLKEDTKIGKIKNENTLKSFELGFRGLFDTSGDCNYD